jgi:hypothetical protein
VAHLGQGNAADCGADLPRLCFKGSAKVIGAIIFPDRYRQVTEKEINDLKAGQTKRTGLENSLDQGGHGGKLSPSVGVIPMRRSSN